MNSVISLRVEGIMCKQSFSFLRDRQKRLIQGQGHTEIRCDGYIILPNLLYFVIGCAYADKATKS